MPIVRPPNSASAIRPDGPSRLFSLHLAEYDALMNRCNYFITLHVGVWGVMVSLFVVIAQQWSADATPEKQGLVIWLGALAIQGLLHIWVTLIEDQYNAVSYIEKNLREAIVADCELPGSERQFWGYEQHLQRTRIRASWAGEYIAPCLVLVILALLVYWRLDAILSSYEWVLVAGNLGLLVALFVRTYLRIKVRRKVATEVLVTPPAL